METVRICGTLKNYNNTPLEGGDIWLKSDSFRNEYEVTTDSQGYFELLVPRKKYLALYACKDYREKYLEYWFWDFSPEDDMNLEIKIDGLEIYGLKAWSLHIKSGWIIYFRPMSLSRSLIYEKLDSKSKHISISPSLELKDIDVTINGCELELVSLNQLVEHHPENTMDAYLIQTLPLSEDISLVGQKVITVEITDKETGERGMGSTIA